MSKSFQELTNHDLQVIKMIATGATVKEMAIAFGSQPDTCRKQRQVVMQKINCATPVHVTHFALASGLVKNIHLSKI